MRGRLGGSDTLNFPIFQMTFNIVVSLKMNHSRLHATTLRIAACGVLSISKGFAAEAQLPIRVVAFETRPEVIVLVGQQLSSARD